MQGDFGSVTPSLPDAVENFWSEMEARRRRRDRSTLAGINSLIAFLVSLAVIAMNVRRKWNVAQAFQAPAKVLHRFEADSPFSITAARDHLRLKFMIAKEQLLADSNLPSRAHQAFPLIG